MCHPVLLLHGCRPLPQAVDYTGSLVISNVGSGTLELDGVYVNLIDASGDATEAATADCPVDNSGGLQTVTGSSTLSIPANGRVTCNFTMTAAGTGSLVATAMTVNGGDVAISKEWPVTSLLADSTCSTLLSGLAVSELGPQGKLMMGNSTTEDEVCSAGSKVLSIPLPSDAPTGKGCVFPVGGRGCRIPVTMAKPVKQLLPVEICGCRRGTGAGLFAKLGSRLSGKAQPVCCPMRGILDAQQTAASS